MKKWILTLLIPVTVAVIGVSAFVVVKAWPGDVHRDKATATVSDNESDAEVEDSKAVIVETDGTDNTDSTNGITVKRELSVDEIFRDISLSFEGISPNITISIENNSTDPFIKGLVFSTVDYKEKYAVGDKIKIRCYYDEKASLTNDCYIGASPEECIKEYEVTGCDEYVSNLSDIPDTIIEEAIQEGMKAFTDANEYGVRIFCEAHLVPVYIDGQATFRYLTPNIIAGYFKSVNEDEAGKTGNCYNELDLIYKVGITQADGVTCTCEAVVRFTDLVRRSDGSLAYDFSEPKIISASHNNASIHENVVTRYEDTYKIEKLEL